MDINEIKKEAIQSINDDNLYNLKKRVEQLIRKIVDIDNTISSLEDEKIIYKKEIKNIHLEIVGDIDLEQ